MVAHKLDVNLFNGVKFRMMESLQNAVHDCVVHAVNTLDEEISRLQRDHEQEIADLQQQLKIMSECQATLRRESQIVAKGAGGGLSAASTETVHASNGSAGKGSALHQAIHEARENANTSPERLYCSNVHSRALSRTPSKNFTLVMTPVSSQTCSSSSCSNNIDGESAEGLRLSEVDTPQPPPSTISEAVVQESPSGFTAAVHREVTPPRASCASRGSKAAHGGVGLEQAACNGQVEHSSTVDKTPPGKTESLASPLPADPPVLGTPRSHTRSSLDDVKGCSSSVKYTTIRDKSPTVLEPDTIEILRAALMETPDDANSCTPKTSKGSLTLPAAVQGRNHGTTGESNGPMLQGSPLVPLVFDTPRGGSTTPRQPARSPKLGHIFSTPAGPATSAQAAASTQDAQDNTASPARPNSELKSRRLSWPSSSPRNPVRATRTKEASEGDDSTMANLGTNIADASEQAQGPGSSKFQPMAPVNPAASPKVMAEVDQEGGPIDGSSLHGVASPLRRRWLGVLSGRPTTSAVTPKPPAQRL
jgi:hypothetical protein